MKMDLQTYLNNAMTASRNEELKSMDVLLLGELVAKLEAIADKTKKVMFDFDDQKPTPLDSWRGIYAELAFGFSKEVSPTVEDIYLDAKHAVGKKFQGYKGGEYIMGKQTPIWVANYGDSGVQNYRGEEYTNVGIIGLTDGDVVTLVTKAFE